MKAELVNLVTKNGTETVVMLSTDLDNITVVERVRVIELTVWLVDEGWTVVTSVESPLAAPVRKAAAAMSGTYRQLEETAGIRVEPSPDHLPPRMQ